MSHRHPSRVPLLGALSAALPLLLLSMPQSTLAAPPATGVITDTGQILTSLTPPTPANGSYDLQFQVFNAASGGTQVGPTLSLAAVPVVDGVFYAELNFGAVVGAPGLYLQTSYRTAGGTTYTVQSPRKLLPQSGYADYATQAGYAATAGTAATASASNTTKGLQAKGVSAAVPATGQVLTYNGTLWAPATPATGAAYTAGAGLSLSGTQFSVATGGVTGTMLALPLFLGASNPGPLLSVNDPGGTGIAGSSGSGFGVYGTNTATGGYGFLGGTATVEGSSHPLGVFGSDSSAAGSGGAGVLGSSTNGSGVYGDSPNGYGVFANSGSSDAGYFQTTSGPSGVYAQSQATGGHGLFGQANGGATAQGVAGVSSSGTGVYGSGGSGDYGLLGGVDPVSGNSHPVGVFGEDSTSGSAGYGVYGNSGAGAGVYGAASAGVGVQGSSTNGSGVYGASATGDAGHFLSGGLNGLYAESQRLNGNGIEGVANSGAGAYGVYGVSTSGAAGYFQGNVTVTGAIYAGTKDFKIDHPLDPANKYLYHASVESDRMEDVYHGHVTTDAQGNAAVTLPAWFQALNTDFEYQLTVVGQFAQAVVAQEIRNNRFTIKTDKPGVKVSWQVTGVRHDAYALAHPLQVEQDKPERELGLYQNPDAFGQPEDRGVGFQKRTAPARP